ETVCGKLFRDLLVNHNLPRRKLDYQGHEHSLGFHFSGAPSIEVLLEKDSLGPGGLIAEPQTFAVHRNNKARAHLTERFQVGDLLWSRKRGRRAWVRRNEISSPVRGSECWSSRCCGKRDARITGRRWPRRKSEALLNRPKRVG